QNVRGDSSLSRHISSAHYVLAVFSASISTPRRLHSFPTRRSSDLPFFREDNASAPDGGRHQGRHAGDGARRQDRLLGVSPACQQDRKSTRLNSSHVKISYAVCCLEKK